MTSRPRIRPLTRLDIEQVVDLHLEAFGNRDNPIDDVRDFYRRLLPSADASQAEWLSPSQAAEADGEVIAMVLAARTHATVQGRPLVGVTGSMLAARSGHGSALLAHRLLAEVAQQGDFTWGDRINDMGRRAAQAAGFVCYPGYSLRWGLVLSPARAAAAGIMHRRDSLPGPVRYLLRRSGGLLDAAVGGRLAGKGQSGRVPTRGLVLAPLEPATLVDEGAALIHDLHLTPDLSSVERIEQSWSRLDDRTRSCALVRSEVRNASGDLIGWYLIHRWTTGIGEVVQLVAHPKRYDRVIAVMLEQARDLSIASLHGSIHPPLVTPLGEAGAFFHGRGAAVGVQSELPEVHQAFASGTALLSGLEGEYPLQLSPIANRL